jgi:hypothetical protein
VDYVDPRSLEFGTNAESMRVLVAELREMLDGVAGGGEASRARHTSRGKTERHFNFAEQGTSGHLNLVATLPRLKNAWRPKARAEPRPRPQILRPN